MEGMAVLEEGRRRACESPYPEGSLREDPVSRLSHEERHGLQCPVREPPVILAARMR